MKKIAKMLKEKRGGFTLVEMVVVLVIIAILATLGLGALTGYIDRANERAATAECRAVVLAAQTIASEKYATAKGAAITMTKAEVSTLASVPVADIVKIFFDSKNGKISFVETITAGYTTTYTGSTGVMSNPAKNAATEQATASGEGSAS